ncbi:MAG: ROK family protein, partial [Thermomicrobiales bacterium]
ARQQTPTQPEHGVDAVLDRIAEAVAGVVRATNLSADTPVGVALPGPVNPRTGYVGLAPNLGWDDLPIRDLLQEKLQRPVVAGNDVNTAALGEWHYGVGRGTRHLVFLAVGTGLGSGVVVDGTLLVGHEGLATEAGHMVIALDGPPCHCGGRGCLEAFVSGWAIELAAQNLLDSGRPSLLTDLMRQRGERLSGTLITEAAQQGDAVATEVLARAGHALGMAVASLVHLFNPEVVAIGGGVVAAGPLLFDPVRAAVQAHAMAAFTRHLQIVPSALDQDAGLLGAAVLARTP